MSSKLILNLEGALQSWGESSKSNDSGYRSSLDHPTKSGVVGILCAALGISMKKEHTKVQELSKSLSMDVIVSRKGSLLKDFQSLGTNYDTKDAFEKRAVLCKTRDDGTIGSKADCPTKIFTKEYLHNAHFVVVLHTTEERASELLEALNNPKWPVYLGRKCCLPSSPVGVRVTSTEEETNQVISTLTGKGEKEVYTEDPEGMPYMDEPLGGLKYGVRYVTKETLSF